ncbi:hypothetical protein [Pseudomonas gingeri]|nr:hypothetical protein [Pseudomonas gingeri]
MQADFVAVELCRLEQVRGALDTISKNEEFIKMTLAVLMAPE